MSLESPADTVHGEISALIETLLDAERRLEELTGGEVDTVAGRDGRPFFLRRAQDQSRYREAARQAGILNALPASIALLDAQGVIVSVNDAWRIFPEGGESPDPRYGLRSNYFDVCDHACGRYLFDASRVSAGVQSVLDGRASCFAVDFPCDVSGERRWFQLTVTPLTVDWPNGVVVMYTDITERRLAEGTLRASEANMATAQRIAHFGSWELDLADREDVDANALRWSDEMFRIAGFEPGSVAVDNALFFSLVPPDDQGAIREAIATAISKRERYAVQHRIIRPGGEIRFVREAGLIVFDEETGQPLRIVGTAHDVTDQLRLAEQLDAERARLVAAQSIAKIGSWETNLSTLEVAWSEEVHRIFGTNPATFRPLYSDFMRFVHPEDRPAVDDALLRSMTPPFSCAVEHRVLLQDGTIKFVEERWHVSLDEGGKPIRALGTCQDITERKWGETTLRRSEDRFSVVFEHAPIGMALKSTNGRWLKVNRALCDLLGYSAEDFTSLDFPEITHPDDLEPTQEGKCRVVAGEIDTFEIEKRYRHRLGHFITASLSLTLVRDDEGYPNYFIAHIQDVTERKRAAEEVKAALMRLNEAQRIGQIGDWTTSVATGEVTWSAQVFEIFGRDPQLGPPRSHEEFSTVLDPPSRASMEEQMARIMQTGDPQENEIRVIRPSGEPIYVLARAAARKDASDRITAIYGTVQDITERKRAETLLRNSQQSLLLAAESVRLGIWDWDVVANKMEWDARMFDLYGIREHDFTNAYGSWEKGLHLEDREGAEAAVNAALAGTEDFHTDFRVVWPTGEVRHIEAHAVVQRADDGSPVRMIGVNWDITERKGSERALRESEERFRKMLENVELLAMTLDMDGKVTFCNDHLLRVSGWDREDVVGNDWFSRFVVDADQIDRRALFDAIKQNDVPTRLESEFLTKSGETRQIAWNVAMLKDASARVVGTAAIGEDITARKALQEQLLQSQKMESLGSLAGGIAHDFNNLLTGMLGYAELAQMKLPADSPIQPDLEEICQSANRAATLTRQLLSFARKEVVEPKVVDLGALAEGLRNLIGRLIGVDIDLVVRWSPDLGRVKVDPSQFEQVLVNLAVNARDAMPSGGTLVVDVSNRTVDEVQETIGSKLQPGRYVVLTVTDTGIGMTKEVQARVFDPFFTTKEKGKGTGLGLSTCYGIVTNCGGKIWAYSEVGVGTAFHIYFPRVDESLSSRQSVGREEAVGRGETVLVVDDEDTVRTLAVAVLKSAGYLVLHASDGKAATGLVAEYEDRIDLMVTDVVMPGMNGPALADVVRLLKPQIRILFMSGFTDDAIIHDGDATRESSFLQKPFSPAQLAQKVREALDQEP